MAPPLVDTGEVNTVDLAVIDVSDEPNRLRRRFEKLRRDAADAFDETQYQKSRELYARALELARRIEDATLEDRAFCGHTAASLALGEGEEQVGPLRETLMRSGDDETSFLASYILATQVFDSEADYRKSLFYSRVARTHAERLGRMDWLASCHNQIGNALLATSFFDGARKEYETAFELVPEDAHFERALILDSLGYCRLVQGRHSEGFGMIFSSLRTLRRLELPRFEALPRLSLAYGYVGIGRYRPALRHAFKALQLSETAEDAELTKQALYMLGEAAKIAGAYHSAYRFYNRLQTEFYPGDNSLAELLLTVDTRDLVNLRA